MLCVAAVLRYCIVALAVSVYLEVGVMEKLQKMYFISVKADDKTSQCNVDVRMMYLLRVFVFLFFLVFDLSCFHMAIIYGMCKLILRFLVIFLLKQWQVILSYDVSSFVFFRHM